MQESLLGDLAVYELLPGHITRPELPLKCLVSDEETHEKHDANDQRENGDSVPEAEAPFRMTIHRCDHRGDESPSVRAGFMQNFLHSPYSKHRSGQNSLQLGPNKQYIRFLPGEAGRGSSKSQNSSSKGIPEQSAV